MGQKKHTESTMGTLEKYEDSDSNCGLEKKKKEAHCPRIWTTNTVEVGLCESKMENLLSHHKRPKLGVTHA